jgi:Flp pilus assembly protein TadG
MHPVVRSHLPRRGQAAIMMALSIPLVFGLMGMVVDVGWAYWREEACKTAAQAAAFASARQAQLAANLTCGSGVTCQSTTANCPSTLAATPSNNLMAGCNYAKANGFVNTGRQLVMYQANTVSSPVTGVSPSYWVRFTVTEQIPTLFAAVMGAKYTTISARATAGTWSSANGGCVYVLSPNNGAWSQSGGTFSTGCGIYDNGGVTMSGGVDTLGSGNASSIVKFSYAGTLSKSGGIVNPSTNLVAGGAVSNPVSGLPAPSAGTCLADPHISGGNNISIPAGTYCNGISISGGTNITFASGTFIFTGTGASVNISGGTPISVASGGAMFYFNNAAGGFNVSGGNVTLTAPTSGTYAGFAIWKDATYAGLSSFNMSGSNTAINGIIYMPNTTINYSGSNTAVQQSIICYNINMSGGNISQPATSSYFSNGGAAGGAYLIE